MGGGGDPLRPHMAHVTHISYIDRACAHGGKQLTPDTVNSYLAGALLLATKWCDDRSHCTLLQTRCANVLGISLKTLNKLEVHFLTDLRYALVCTRCLCLGGVTRDASRWELYVDSAQYDAYCAGFNELFKKKGGPSACHHRSKSAG